MKSKMFTVIASPDRDVFFGEPEGSLGCADCCFMDMEDGIHPVCWAGLCEDTSFGSLIFTAERTERSICKAVLDENGNWILKELEEENE